MKLQILTTFILLYSFPLFAQFQDTAVLRNYIIENIRDKRPEKVTAEQIQTSLLGIMRNQTVPATGNGIVNEAGTFKLGGNISQLTTIRGNEYSGGMLLKKLQHFNVDSTNYINLLGYTAVQLGHPGHQNTIMKDDYIQHNANNSITLNTNSIWLMTYPYYNGMYNGVHLSGYRNNANQDSVLTTDAIGKMKFTYLKHLGNSDLTVTSNRTVQGNHGLLSFQGFGLIQLKSFGDKSIVQVTENGSLALESVGNVSTSKVYLMDGNLVRMLSANSGIEVNTGGFKVIKHNTTGGWDTKFSVDYNGNATFSTPAKFTKAVSLPIRRIFTTNPVNLTDSDYTVLIGPSIDNQDEVVVNLPDATNNDGLVLTIKITFNPDPEIPNQNLTVKVTAFGSQKIEDWESEYPLTPNTGSATLQALGGVWYLLNKN